jgi:hypothetical protein
MHWYMTPGDDLLITVVFLVIGGSGRKMMPRDEFGAQQTFFIFSMLLLFLMTQDAVVSVGSAIADTLR